MLVQARTPSDTALKIKVTVYCTDSANAVMLANNTLRIPSDTHKCNRNAAPSLRFVASVI
jgi:hypothetical protein